MRASEMEDTGEFRAILKKYLDKEVPFDPYNAERYRNYFFQTQHSMYHIDGECRIEGRPSVNNTKVEMIAGIDPAAFMEAYHDLGWCCRPGEISKEEVVWLVLKHGQEPREGRLLVAVMDTMGFEEHKTPWIITTKVDGKYPVC